MKFEGRSIQISYQKPKTYDEVGFEDLEWFDLEGVTSCKFLTKKQRRRLNKKQRKADKLARGEL